MADDSILSCLADLREAVTANGGWMGNALEFRNDEVKGVGIFTLEPIQRGTIIMSIPYNLCISVDSVLCEPCLRKIVTAYPVLESCPDEILCIGLLYAVTNLEASCEWALHVRTLPRELNTTLYWNEEEMTELKGCNVFHLTRMLKAQIARDWENLIEPLAQEFTQELGQSTLELYTWALSMVYSRAVGITRHRKYIRCIPPLLDMANHCSEAGRDTCDTFHFDEESDAILFLSREPRDVGDECFAVYGRYSNAKLAYTYGFVEVPSKYRSVDLWTKVTPNTSYYEKKQVLLQSHSLTREQTYDFEGTIREGGFIAPALLATIRVIQASQEELEDEEGMERAFLGQMISVRNEAATYTSLRNLLLAKMNVEKAEADKEELGRLLLSRNDDGFSSYRKLMALVIRNDERDLMLEIMQVVDGNIEQLSQMQ